MVISELTLPELKFWYRSFIAYLNYLLTKQKSGECMIEGNSIDSEIRKAESMLNDLNHLTKKRISEES